MSEHDITVESLVRESKSPQEAMLALAHGIDSVLEALAHQPAAGSWSGVWETNAWDNDEAHKDGARAFKEQVDNEVGVTTIEIPPPSVDKYNARAVFAKHRLDLDGYYSTGEAVPDPFPTWQEWYAKLGPYALYTFDRECVMSYPRDVREIMVTDVIEDNPEVAHDMGRDVLKHEAASGPHEVGMGTDLMGDAPNRVR